MSNKLNPENALIFRIVHVKNVSWIVEHGGLYCRSHKKQDRDYVNIGNPELISKRSGKSVPISPFGTLSDYVPFYFTPFSIMMYNIKTGYGGITRRENEEIAIFVASLWKLDELEIPFIFTNQHAYSARTDYFSDLDDLDKIDWDILQRRDFKTSDRDPGKQLRYQAEALIHRHMPLHGLNGIGCCNTKVKDKLLRLLEECDVDLPVKITPNWYF